MWDIEQTGWFTEQLDPVFQGASKHAHCIWPEAEPAIESDNPFATNSEGEESDDTSSTSDDDCLEGEIITDNVEDYYIYSRNLSSTCKIL